MKSSKKDILRSQSNEIARGEEEDEEIMALIDERERKSRKMTKNDEKK